MSEWWRDAVFYQIYPRSFLDTDGDGSGDLPGVIARLDWLAGLGVDALWVSPFFPSPMKDWGYDAADYCGVDPAFGTMDDARRLVAEAHRRGIRVILDLVANHCSDEHPWFKAARASRDAPEHDLFIWKPLAGPPPNNWKCMFELSSAWFPNEATGERYLATFTRFQPEFDWRNPALRERIYEVMRFWLGMGIDGFRLDVATAYLKDAEFRSNPPSPVAHPDFFQRHVHDRNRPEVHEIFRDMRALCDSFGDATRPGPDGRPVPGPGRLLVGETHGNDAALAASCHGTGEDELHMAFNFDFLHQPWDARAFRRSVERWYAALPAGAWPNFTLSNHDQTRHATRYAPGPFAPAGSRDARAKAAAALLLGLRGTPFLYNGEEIGMGSVRIPRRALRDPLGIRTWPLAFVGRDPERTPLQWDASPNAGFTAGRPWLPVNPDYVSRNVAAQEEDPSSVLSWYRRLLALRRDSPVLRGGSLRFLEAGRDVFAHLREAPEGRVAVYVNFALGSRKVPAEAAPGGRVLASSAGRPEGETLPAGSLTLGPSEALFVALD